MDAIRKTGNEPSTNRARDVKRLDKNDRRMEWPIVSKAADRSSRERRETVFTMSRHKITNDLEKEYLGTMPGTES